jgi:thiol-disulfide isomerase/thioredoxin
MQPNNPVRGIQAVQTGPDGSFVAKTFSSEHALLVMDRERKRAGLALLPPGSEARPLEIHLKPLVRVKAKFTTRESKSPIYWINVYVQIAAEPEKPLDTTRLLHCGSFESRFEVLLPPGEYTLDAYGTTKPEGNINVKVLPEPRIVVPDGVAELDLGTLEMGPTPRSRPELEDDAKAAGRWYEFKKHFGEFPPQIHAADSRNTKVSTQIADYRGKWVLVAFWGPSCRPCMGTEMPKLMKFYEEHTADRDRFEILGVCIDFDGEIKTMTDLDRAIAPVVDKVWKGKRPQFPILLDNTFKTWERFGIDGLGTVLLIDPEGRMVEGDETTLAERLKR